MSRSRRRELGLSSREYEEALLLERVFQLVKRHRCATCLVRKPTHVDQDRYELLCESCARRCPYKIQIGSDHLPKSVLERLEASYSRGDRGKGPSPRLSSSKKKSSHRRKHSVSSYSSASVSSASSVELRKTRHSKKHPQSFESISTQESVYRHGPSSSRPKSRSKAHGRRRSVSSQSSYESVRAGRHQGHHADEDLFAPGYHGRREYEGGYVRSQRRDAYDSSPTQDEYRMGAGVYEPVEAYRDECPASVRGHRQAKDPYGYDLPLGADMPGMVGIMASQQPVSRRGGRRSEGGWPVVGVQSQRECSAVALYEEDHGDVRLSRGRASARPALPAVADLEPSHGRRVGGSNPFAASESKAAQRAFGVGVVARAGDRAMERFDMSSMRLALPCPAGGAQRVSTAACVGYDAPSGRGVRPGPSYGGLYERRRHR